MPRILVVDDEIALLELVSAILENAGYDVITANSGAKALEILEKEAVDLILLDVMMPEMDGWEVVRKVKKNPRIKNIPIALLTVKTMSPHYFYSSEIEGLVDYINKPFSKKDLIERVKTILNEFSRVKSIKKGLKSSSPDFMAEYEEISKTERLYENLRRSLEFSLARTDEDTPDYRLIKDAIDYGDVLLERVQEKKLNYEKLIDEN